LCTLQSPPRPPRGCEWEVGHSATCASSHECTYVPQIAAISHRIMQQFYATHIRMNIVPQGYPRAPEPRIERARCNKPSIWFIVGRHHKPVRVSTKHWLPPHCICHNDGQKLPRGLSSCHYSRHNSENQGRGAPGVPIYKDPRGMYVPKGRQYGIQGWEPPVSMSSPSGNIPPAGHVGPRQCTMLVNVAIDSLHTGPRKCPHAT
jgi:hypothetical protein